MAQPAALHQPDIYHQAAAGMPYMHHAGLIPPMIDPMGHDPEMQRHMQELHDKFSKIKEECEKAPVELNAFKQQ